MANILRNFNKLLRLAYFCYIVLLACNISKSDSQISYSKPPEIFDSKYVDCPGNAVEIDFYKRLPQNVTGNVFWTDYVRAYEGGPFINWCTRNYSMGQIEVSLGFGKNNSNKNDMCVAVDIRTQQLMPRSCDMKYSRPCYVPDDNISRFASSNKCRVEYSRTENDVLFFRIYECKILFSDTRCFTDSTSFYPEKTTVIERTSVSLGHYVEFAVPSIGDGYYWCISKHFESKKILYIKDKTKYTAGYAIMVNYNTALNKWLPFVTNYKLIKDLICPSGECEASYESSGESDNNGSFSRGQFPRDEMHVRRVYAEKMLVHVFNGTAKKMFDYMRGDIVFMRKFTACEPIIYVDIPKTDLGENIRYMKDCRMYSCEYDFNTGSFWNISNVTDCDLSSASKSSSDKIKDVLNTMDRIVVDSVNFTNLTLIANMIENVLLIKEDVTIPSKIFQNLEIMVGNVMLPKNENQVKIILKNMAIVVAENIGSIPIIGIKVNSTERDFLNSPMDLLTSGSVIEDTEKNNNIIVNVSSLLTTRPRSRLSFLIFQDDKPFHQDENDERKINSPALSISVENLSRFQKYEYIDIHFRPYNDQEGYEKVCVFWNFSLGHDGQWSQDGCELLEQTAGGLYTCRCYHLSFFALMSNGVSFSREHYNALTIISSTGCILSLIGLIIIGLTAVFFESWRKDVVHNLWIHLSVAVAIMIVSFLFVENNKFQSTSSCVISGAILHYSVLATFCWMLAAAAFYFQMTVNVFESRSSSSRIQKLKAIIVGWLIPIVPVTSLLLSDYESYTNHKYFCYPSGTGFWLAVFLPVISIIIVNTFLFFYILYSILFTSQVRKHVGDNKRILRSFKLLVILFYQFGLIWVFGLLSKFLFMAYVFCISATLQGLILCFFFVVGNQNTMSLWLVKLNITKAKIIPTAALYTASGDKSQKNNYRLPIKCENDSTELLS